MSKIKLSAVAVAAIGMFSGAAQAQYIASSGASALRGTTLQLFANTCPGGAGTAQVFQAAGTTSSVEGGSNVRAVRCGAAGGKVFSLDTDGGSWRAYAVQNLAQINSQAIAIGATDPTVKPIRYLDLALCPTAGTLASPGVCNAGASKNVAAGNTGGAPTDVSIGFTDVNPAFFDGVTGANLGQDVNRPNGFIGWPKFTPAVTNSFPALGVVFGVGLSRTLYTELMADQGITAATQPTCFPGGVADLANEACAPSITKDQYRSLTTANFGQLNLTYANLFKGTAPAGGVQVERRDFGSGTQAAANAYFHGIGCTPYFVAPATAADSSAPDYVVTENAASGDVVTRLSAAGVRRVGVISRETAPTAAGGWGFAKLNGVYPTNANATRGLYDFWSVAWVHAKAGATGDVGALVTALQSGTGFTPGAGTIKLDAITTGTSGTGTGTVTAGTYYGRDGMSAACTGAQAN